MAPEVIRGNERYGFSADVWSVGIVVIEMSTGKPPFHSLGTISALFTIGNSNKPPPFPETLSEVAKDFLTQALQVYENLFSTYFFFLLTREQ